MDFIVKCIQKERPLMSDLDAERIASAIREEIMKRKTLWRWKESRGPLIESWVIKETASYIYMSDSEHTQYPNIYLKSEIDLYEMEQEAGNE